MRLNGVGFEAVAEWLKTTPKRVSLWSEQRAGNEQKHRESCQNVFHSVLAVWLWGLRCSNRLGGVDHVQPLAYPDTDVGSPNSVTFGDGYFFFTYGNGQVIASDLNATSINPLSTIQINAACDGCVRGIWW